MPLEKIPRLVDGLFSLVARNRSKPLLKVGFFNIIGAIEMLAGLEYHHDNIVRRSAALGAGGDQDETRLYHEAVAYVNRMGQFYYFAKSELVSQAVPDSVSSIPTIAKFMVFRMKHTAHRSMDVPREQDTNDLRISHARSLTRFWGKMMTLKPGYPDVDFPRVPMTDR